MAIQILRMRKAMKDENNNNNNHSGAYWVW